MKAKGIKWINCKFCENRLDRFGNCRNEDCKIHHMDYATLNHSKNFDNHESFYNELNQDLMEFN